MTLTNTIYHPDHEYRCYECKNASLRFPHAEPASIEELIRQKRLKCIARMGQRHPRNIPALIASGLLVYNPQASSPVCHGFRSEKDLRPYAERFKIFEWLCAHEYAVPAPRTGGNKQ